MFCDSQNHRSHFQNLERQQAQINQKLINTQSIKISLQKITKYLIQTDNKYTMSSQYDKMLQKLDIKPQSLIESSSRKNYNQYASNLRKIEKLKLNFKCDEKEPNMKQKTLIPQNQRSHKTHLLQDNDNNSAINPQIHSPLDGDIISQLRGKENEEDGGQTDNEYFFSQITQCEEIYKQLSDTIQKATPVRFTKGEGNYFNQKKETESVNSKNKQRDIINQSESIKQNFRNITDSAWKDEEIICLTDALNQTNISKNKGICDIMKAYNELIDTERFLCRTQNEIKQKLTKDLKLYLNKEQTQMDESYSYFFPSFSVKQEI